MGNWNLISSFKFRRRHQTLTGCFNPQFVLIGFARFGYITPANGDVFLAAVLNDRHNYYLTRKAWAENLESARDEIFSRWGDMLYRRFRLYLWGSAYAFLSRSMDAYRVVLERPDISEQS